MYPYDEEDPAPSGIRRRRVRPEELDPTPTPQPPEPAANIPAREAEFTSPSTEQFQPPAIADANAPTASGVRPRRAAPDSAAPPMETRPSRVNPIGSMQGNQDELWGLQNNPAHKTSRWKAALINALINMGQQANQVLASGRPVDEYGLARVAGAAAGGAAGGVINPAVNEERKRKARMAELSGQIQQQLATEKQQAEIQRTRTEAEVYRQKPQIDAARQRRLAKPKPQVIGGIQYDYKPRMDENGIVTDANGDAVWDAYPLGPEDRSKIPNVAGVLPGEAAKIAANKEIAATNQNFKAAESEKERQFHASQNEEQRKIQRARLAEQIRQDMERDRQTAIREGRLSATATAKVKLGIAQAKINAAAHFVPLNDYIDALSEVGVEVTPDEKKK